MTRPSLLFVVESGTDVRMVEGLAARFRLTVLVRSIPGARVISWPPATPVEIVKGPPGRVPFARWAAAEATRRRADHVMVQGYGLAALGVNDAVDGATMLVCSPAERYYRARRTAGRSDMPYRSWELLAMKLVARANARMGARYIVLSEHLADTVRGHGTERPVHVIPVYGVDTERFAPVTADGRHGIRKTLGLPQEMPVIFFSSRVAPEKDAETLLAALRRLADQGRQFLLLHLSGGWKAFADAATRFGLADRTVARDAVHPIHELAAWYQASDLCVQASREEGLGFSVLEALACGVPVIASGVGGLRETVRPGETGWSYPTGHHEALADAITTALDDSGASAERTARGRTMVRERFTADSAFDRLREALGT